MNPRWPVIFVVLYVVNLALLFIAPWYGSSWAALGTTLVGNSEYPWLWAAVGEAIRFMVIAGLAWSIARWWPESDQDSTPDDIDRVDSFFESFNVTFWFPPRAYRDTLKALNGKEGSARLRILESRAETLPDGLSTWQVQRLIGRLENYDKVRALGMLVGKLAPNVRRHKLLKGLTGHYRDMAERLLQP